MGSAWFGKSVLGVNAAQSSLTLQTGAWGWWEEEPDIGLPLVFLHLSISGFIFNFFLVCP